MTRALPLLLCLASPLALAQSPDAGVGAQPGSKLGCLDLLAQARTNCREIFTRGSRSPCQSLTSALAKASKQAGGALFTSGDAEAAHASNDLCRERLDALQLPPGKREGSGAAPSISAPVCAELAQVLDRDCFDDFAQRGAFSPACRQVFNSADASVMRSISNQAFRGPGAQAAEPGLDPAARCEEALSLYRRLAKRAAP